MIILQTKKKTHDNICAEKIWTTFKIKKNKNGKRCKKKKKRVEKCEELDRNDQTYVVHWL